jgi:hypothetical protein
MSIREYIFINDRRLNTYFDQISDPVSYDKVPQTAAKSASLSSGTNGRQPTRFRICRTRMRLSNML